MILKRPSYFVLLTFPLLLLFTPRHVDERFNWQTLESGSLKIHWYEGDVDFGQDALETAQAGLASISSFVPLNLEQPAEIFIYANADDLHSDLVPGREDVAVAPWRHWVAGHADPALGLVRVLIGPGPQQAIEMEQRIPHELMHVMLYRHVGAGYNNLPAWLSEGMATLAEIYPNAHHERVLQEAITSKRLIPLQDLCVSFPNEPAEAFLAYAESRSFTNYLYETYGSTGLLNVAALYADGIDCERGAEYAFGASLSILEHKWRSSLLEQNGFLPALQNISPYLVLLCLVLVVPLLGLIGTLRKKGTRNGSGTEIRR
jgi:hypothetical protein